MAVPLGRTSLLSGSRLFSDPAAIPGDASGASFSGVCFEWTGGRRRFPRLSGLDIFRGNPSDGSLSGIRYVADSSEPQAQGTNTCIRIPFNPKAVQIRCLIRVTRADESQPLDFLNFAQPRLCAAAILALLCADIFRRLCPGLLFPP
jgi:hypothetical protein